MAATAPFMKRKFAAAVLLLLLIGVPFLNWRLGAVLWMCAWLIFILQNLFARRNWHLGNEEEEEENSENNKEV
jgi:uncharacterized MAPEG superfamily protein